MISTIDWAGYIERHFRLTGQALFDFVDAAGCHIHVKWLADAPDLGRFRMRPDPRAAGYHTCSAATLNRHLAARRDLVLKGVF